jgi:glycosyltransferase involved in cell wall biosynthesis
MIVERFPDYYPTRWGDEEVRRKREAIQAATILLTGTHAAAAELRAFYPAIADRIRTVHYGADHIPEAAPSSAPGTTERHALFVGDRALYKNFRCILEATAEPRWPGATPLVVVGPEPRENELALAERMAPGRVRFLGRVDDARLSELYRTAAATIVPSFEEGFGFPVLESQRAGSAVVCSDIPVFRELAADSARYFDPRRPDQLAEAVASIHEAATSRRLAEAGVLNARRFTWSRCAELTVQIYQEVLALRGRAVPAPITAPPRPVPS